VFFLPWVKRKGNLAGLDPVLSSAPRDERADSQTEHGTCNGGPVVFKPLCIINNGEYSNVKP